MAFSLGGSFWLLMYSEQHRGQPLRKKPQVAATRNGCPKALFTLSQYWGIGQKLLLKPSLLVTKPVWFTPSSVPRNTSLLQSKLAAMACFVLHDIKPPYFIQLHVLKFISLLGPWKPLPGNAHAFARLCATGDLLTGIAYLIRRLLENTASSSVLRQIQELFHSDF